MPVPSNVKWSEDGFAVSPDGTKMVGCSVEFAQLGPKRRIGFGSVERRDGKDPMAPMLLELPEGIPPEAEGRIVRAMLTAIWGEQVILGGSGVPSPTAPAIVLASLPAEAKTDVIDWMVAPPPEEARLGTLVADLAESNAPGPEGLYRRHEQWRIQIDGEPEPRLFRHACIMTGHHGMKTGTRLSMTLQGDWIVHWSSQDIAPAPAMPTEG